MSFCFPVKALESERVLLEPFNAAKHAERLYAALSDHPQIWRYWASGPYESAQDLVESFFKPWNDADARSRTMFVVTDKPSGRVAGMMGYLNASSDQLIVEIGYIAISLTFQRTYLTSNAVGLLMIYAFEELKVRRVMWQCHSDNAPSRRAAERMGFEFEMIKRWDRVLPPGKEGDRRGDEEKRGRHTALFAICWDDWDEGGKEHVQKVMKRTA